MSLRAARALAPLFLLLAAAAQAQDFPSRPVHLIVPYTPGTGADLLARVIAPKLSERWKVAVVTENRPGATGNIGAEAVAKSPPDGHAILFAATSFATNPALSPAPYDPEKSFEPVALVATSSLAVLVNPKSPARDMREFVELARREPGKLHYATPGSGSVQHLAMELVKLETGIDVVHVPYKGMGGAVQDLIGGHIEALVAALQTAAPHVQSGRLRMLAILSAQRAPAFPDVPTLKEQGLPDIEVETWYAAFVSAGTPAATVQKINAGINEALGDPSTREALAKQGLATAGGDPARLAALVKKELARWQRVVASAHIKAD